MHNELQAAIPPANEASLQFQARPKPSLQDPIPPNCSTFPTIFGSSFSIAPVLHIRLSARPCQSRPPPDPLATTVWHVLGQESHEQGEAFFLGSNTHLQTRTGQSHNE